MRQGQVLVGGGSWPITCGSVRVNGLCNWVRVEDGCCLRSENEGCTDIQGGVCFVGSFFWWGGGSLALSLNPSIISGLVGGDDCVEKFVFGISLTEACR